MIPQEIIRQKRNGAELPTGDIDAFIAALAEDFEKHGVEVIERVRIDKPEAYIKVIASLLPKDLNLNVSKYDHLTDAQLISRLRTLTKQAEPLIGRLIGPDQAAASSTSARFASARATHLAAP